MVGVGWLVSRVGWERSEHETYSDGIWRRHTRKMSRVDAEKESKVRVYRVERIGESEY